MKAILIKKDPARQSRYGGMYIRCHFRSFEDGVTRTLDVYEGHSKSKRFFETGLPLQGVFDNLDIYKNKFIDGTSAFKYLGKKKTNETI